MSWEELLKKVKQHGETLDVAGKRRSMTSLAESLGLSSEEMTSRDTVGTRTRKLRSFSGAKDSEPGVVDYDPWRMYASSDVDSTRLSENERKRILIDSLLRPALDIATTLDATKTSQDLLHVLDHHYGEVSDGYELYTQFRSSIQDVKEYLQRLHLLALKATQREGMRKQDIAKEVIRQFESGCADKDLLNRIDICGLLEDETLPSVDEVLLLVRTEESRRKEKKLRLKARNARVNMLKVQESDMAAEMASLQKKVEALTLQLQSQTTPGAQGGGVQPGTYSPTGHQPGASSFQGQLQRTDLARGRVVAPVAGDREDSSLAEVGGRKGSVSCVARMVTFRLPARVQGMLSWSSRDYLLQLRGLMGLSIAFRESGSCLWCYGTSRGTRNEESHGW